MSHGIYIFLIVLFLFSCKNKNNDSDSDIVNNVQNIENIEEDNINEQIDNDEYITIKGEQIWVRSEPSTGNVVMKLDDGSKCTLLEKGKQETIKGTTDYWYKISFEGEEGWVFGSQTSLCQNMKVDENEEIKTFFANFFENVKENNISELKKFFIDDSVFVLYNPGAILVFSTSHYTDAIDNFDGINFDDDIQTDSKPIFDMDMYEWSATGFFLLIEHRKTAITYLTEYMEGYSDFIIEKASNVEKFITYKLLIAYSDGIYVYVGKINNQWKIIAIDVSTNDA